MFPQPAIAPVFAEVASGLGELGALVSEYHQAAVRVSETHDPADMERLGELQHRLEERDGWRLEQKVEHIVSRLSLPAERRMHQLSGGWRRRALLGRALVSEPHLLLLDEPTNHLDIDAIRWLEEYLQGYPGAILFVTHDRAFLTAIATRIVELDRGRFTSWPGSYANYLQKKEAALDAEARELERLDKKLLKEEAWLRQGVKARRTRNEGRVRALMALRAERAAYRAQSGTVRIAVDDGQGSGKLVFEAEQVSKSFAGRVVIRDYSQRILRGDRVGLIGPNGSGKTTLLRLLLGELAPDSGEVRHGARLQVAYFDQQREQLDPDATLADSVNEGNTTVIVNGQPRHIVGYLADFLFPRERVQSPVRSLSGGERNRLMLARLFARPANVLVLDEPTNDLDIETLELLEELIGAFDGTVLLVSHDRAFLDNIVTSTVAFEGDGRVREYVGGWEDYVRQSARSAGPAARGSGDRTSAGPVDSRLARRTAGRGREKRKLSYNEQREFDALPARIEALEAEQRALSAEMEAPDFYKSGGDRINVVMARLASRWRGARDAAGTLAGAGRPGLTPPHCVPFSYAVFQDGAECHASPESLGRVLRQTFQRSASSAGVAFHLLSPSSNRTLMFQTLNSPAADAPAPFVSWYDASRQTDRDRRAHDRLVAHELEWLKSARLRSGQPLSLIDLSPGGALFETTTPLGPGSTATLTLTGEGITETATFRLLRCEVASLKRGLVFRGACVFDRVLQLPTVPIIGKDRGTSMPAETPGAGGARRSTDSRAHSERRQAHARTQAWREPRHDHRGNARGAGTRRIAADDPAAHRSAAGSCGRQRCRARNPRGARFDPAGRASSQPNLDPRTGPGWNRIVVRYLDGRMLKGFSQDFHPGRATFHVSAATSALDVKPVLVPMTQLKAIFFVRDFAGNPGRVDGQAFAQNQPGRRIEVTFLDDEVLLGATLGYRPDGSGFFVTPADNEGNNLRVFVLAGAIRHVRYL